MSIFKEFELFLDNKLNYNVKIHKEIKHCLNLKGYHLKNNTLLLNKKQFEVFLLKNNLTINNSILVKNVLNVGLFERT